MFIKCLLNVYSCLLIAMATRVYLCVALIERGWLYPMAFRICHEAWYSCSIHYSFTQLFVFDSKIS